ncbi:hypothetical protein LPJ55_005243 [Coemansia sp. RSA 990]|nr:IucC family-domain-containing protein [Coemansia mojavensis]KAJ1739123.1 hypothetical protein LPJ68_004952 [Coemansia sp. RSA 1086]KAJ1747575.1 hypothetical protein LPJ79_005148 [Coemansia sp. RSA 1821]KAJ1869605.1 hypothetical protein LPJ55_005243 [Coemansia sp. RSA 990]
MGIETQPQPRISLLSSELHALLESSPCSPYQIPCTAEGYAKRALFATTSRLFACLVNEQIVDGYFVDCNGSNTGTTSHLLIVPHASQLQSWKAGFMAIQLRHRPVVATKPAEGAANIYAIRLLDPEDMGVGQWIIQSDADAVPITDAGQIMNQVGIWNAYKDTAVAAIRQELCSSVANQLYAYMHQRPRPNIMHSTAIEWEQSIIEGHATHPMHRARYAEPPLMPISPDTELYQLRLAFVAIPRSEMTIEGMFEELLEPLYRQADPATDAVSNDSRYILDHVDRSLELVLPAHPVHVPAILELFKSARLLSFTVSAAAQASIRTVCPKALEPLGYDIKLPLGAKISSALRTISPWSTFVGPRITQVIPKILQGAPVNGALLIAGEPASAVSNNSDFDIAKYLSCIIREDPEYICRPRGERVIVAAALTNYSDSGISTVIEQWNLQTIRQRQEFLKDYVDKLFDAFLPPILNHGFAFEAHPQNSLLRIDAETGAIKGFIVRDFGGIKVHRKTFYQSTGVDIDMLPDACTDAQSMYEVYDLAYHTLIQCQIHRLVRSLDLHYQGDGWAIVRESFEQRVPSDHPLRCAWYQETFDLKCFIIMKLDGLYRDYIYRKVANVLFYKNENEGILLP